MALTAGQIPKVANVINSGVAALTGTTVAVIGSSTNGVTAYTAGTSGGRVMSLTATTDDTVAVNVLVYILRGASVLPIGLVTVAITSGALAATKTNVDFLNGANIVGLPIDNSGRQYIPLLANDVLKVATLANLSSAKTCWVVASGNDYQA